MRKRVKALFEVVVLIVGLILSGIASGYAQGLQAKTFSALSAASTNCTLIYGMGPSLLQWVVVVNTTATTYYLKIYNKQTAPVAGTDTPNAINLHGELMAYTMAGMSSFDALKAATVNPAKALGYDGDPIANIANTTKVKKVVANGRVYDVADLVKRGQ